MLWLAAHYPQWALQYFCYRNELGQNTAVLLYEPKSLQVLALDRQSEQAGVKLGMSLSTAQSLMPSAMLVEFDASISQQASDWLCQWSYEFSARVVPLRCSLTVEVQSTPRTKFDVDEFLPDTLLLEVSSMALIFNGIDKLVEQYRQRATALGLEVSLALAKTPLAAQLLACDTSMGNLQAKPTAETFSQNDYLNADKTLQLLKQLPIALLPLSDFLQQSLHDIGIKSFASLSALPDKELGRRFGVKLLQLLAKISGSLPQPLSYFEPEESYQQKLTLLYEVELMQGIVFPLGRMLKEMAGYLQLRQLAIQQLKLSLIYRDSERSQLDITIQYPFSEHRSDRLLSLCRMQLERVTLYQPVVEMVIYVEKFVPIAVSHDSWFGQQKEQQGQRSEKALQLMAQLQARLGKTKVKGLQASYAHLPEDSWIATDLSETAKGQSIAGKRQQAVSETTPGSSALCAGACRPSWLLTMPELIAVEQIELLKGPERLQTLWWQEPQICRDYYVASHYQGGLCWVFREGNRFFLHGWFG